MKISELAEFDGSKYLKDEEAIRHYLAQAFEDGEPRLIQAALGNVAKARGMTALARESGVKREALYRALSEGGKRGVCNDHEGRRRVGIASDRCADHADRRSGTRA